MNNIKNICEYVYNFDIFKETNIIMRNVIYSKIGLKW
jgi:hypothetical protein